VELRLETREIRRVAKNCAPLRLRTERFETGGKKRPSH
jgi:hypothetical protein